MVIFHSKLLVYQRVTPCLTAEKTLFRGGWIEFFPHFFMDKSTTTGSFPGKFPWRWPGWTKRCGTPPWIHRKFIHFLCLFPHLCCFTLGKIPNLSWWTSLLGSVTASVCAFFSSKRPWRLSEQGAPWARFSSLAKTAGRSWRSGFESGPFYGWYPAW